MYGNLPLSQTMLEQAPENWSQLSYAQLLEHSVVKINKSYKFKSFVNSTYTFPNILHTVQMYQHSTINYCVKYFVTNCAI